MFREPRIKDVKYLKWIASLPCIACGIEGDTQAAHLRMSSILFMKRHVGMQEKPDDYWTTPLCVKCHMLQHMMKESEFWEEQKIDPFIICMFLSMYRFNDEKGEKIVKMAKVISLDIKYEGVF